MSRQKLSASQVYAIGYLKKNGKVFVAYNSHLHKATVDALVRFKIAKRVDNGLRIELTNFGKNFKL